MPGTDLQLTRRDEDGTTRLAVAGELDVATGHELRDAVGEALEGGAQRIVVDLASVEFLDSAGLAAVLDAARTAQRLGREFAVSSPSGSEARLVIDLSGTGPILGLDDGGA